MSRRGCGLPGGGGGRVAAGQRWSWAAAIDGSRAWAHMDRTVWRWKECHSRTWCWSRFSLALFRGRETHSSTGHLFPATLIRTGRDTARPLRGGAVVERQVSWV